MSFTDFHKLKQYLLGIHLDDADLERIETQLLSDRSFANEAERIEAELIEDHIHGVMAPADKERFENHSLRSSRIREKYAFMLALNEHAAEYAGKTEQVAAKAAEPAWSFFSMRVFKYAAFAAVLLMAVGIASWIFLGRGSKHDSAAGEAVMAMNNAYTKQRPLEGRISDFDYAPWSVTRGESDNVNTNAITRAGLLVLNIPDAEQTTESLRALGLYFATQNKVDEALKNFEKALAFKPKDARFYADYSAVLIEAAKNGRDVTPEKRIRYLESSLSQSDRALELNSNYLPALFNKALCLQEMNSVTAAREAWQKYIEKDPNSKWSNDARSYLKRLDEKVGVKSSPQVLEDFLNAFEQGDKNLAWKVASESKEMLTGTMVSEQLTRGLLSADAQGVPEDSGRLLSALNFLGQLEKEKSGDLFFSDLATYYTNATKAQRDICHRAQAANSDGYRLILENKVNDAVEKFEEAEKLLNEAGNSVEAAKVGYWIAFSNTELDIAKSHSIATAMESYSRDRSYKWLQAHMLTQSSSNYIRENKHTPGIATANDGLKIAKEIGDTYSQQRLSAQLADLYSRLNEPAEAVTYSQNTLRENSGTYFNSARQLWRNYNFASTVSLRFGLGQTAVAYAKEAVRLNEDSIRDPGMAQNSFFLLSGAYRASDDLQNALNSANESIRLSGLLSQPRQTQTMAEGLVQKGESERLMSDCESAIKSYELAKFFYASLNRDRALGNYRSMKGQLACYEKLGMADRINAEMPAVLAKAETLRAEIENDNSKTSFFATEQDIYEFAAQQALKANNPELAFNYIESGKARTLLDDLKPAEKTAAVAASSTAPAGAEALKSVLPLNDIRNRLPDTSQLVQYAVLRDQLLIWVVSRSKTELVKKDIRGTDLEPLIRELMFNASSIHPDSKRVAALEAQLHSVLLAPVNHLLDPAKDTVIVPDKILCYLPFEILRPAGGKYAIEEHRFSYAPSATLYVILTERAAQRGNRAADETFVGVGNPDFDRDKNPGLRILSMAESEVNASRELYGPNSVKLNNREASKEKVLAAMPSANVFHFAGHYKANDISPAFSKLLINGEKEDDLTAADISRVKLERTNLVVLSACQTAIENYYNGEGAIGIARTFFAVGAPTVVASRWEVDSPATSRLMTAFHHYRKGQKLSAAAALRAAQIDMLKGEDQALRSPYFWAAFAAIGGSEKM